MEIVDEDGAKIAIPNGVKVVFGRGFGFNTDDRTVSRRHVELEVYDEAGGSQTEPRVSFEVLGKNPIWVRSRTDGEVRVFRRLEKGEMVPGDSFCVSGNRPTWFSLRKVGVGDEVEVEEGETRALAVEGELAESFEDFDVSGIDPVKEFGFVVMGHEFDLYPKHKIRNMKSWDWFLEEPRKESEGDDEKFEKKVRTTGKRKKRKDEGNDDDDEWTGESEDDKELVVNMKKVNRPKYSTRSKDRDEPQKYKKSSKISKQKKTYVADEDEDQETLGGFVVGDDEVDQEETNDEEEEEEEEFVEDDDDELDD
ncbi:chromatin modification-related protein EAF7 [Ziziphus jujuba]|uniref:Chromatin modification-related protein EAF7 n=2 Tax=Ziziphus jujuba TaxID=326968 RepID=A0A6P4AP57_ZIZJJ|nr:chromatin modification-related protein EAF7 [Ziziphus jujuba]KAH7547154.1 hypothetical protein FEM48_Zijuj01G0279300 [Ziziphus jujuba var. spinosa]